MMAFQVGERSSRRGFTLVELLIVIAIVVLLLAILLPTLSSMQSDRRQAVCANNLRNLGLGLAAASRAGEPLKSTNWSDAILPFIGEEAGLLYCPEHGTSAVSYGMNNHAHRFGDEDAHRIALLDYKTTEAEIVVRDIAEQDPWSPTDGRYAARHANQINVLLHSGSVQPRSPESIDPRVTETWLGNWRPHRDDFVIGGAVEKTPSSSLVAANSEDAAGPGLAAASSTDPSELPPLDPDNYCKYETFIDLDDGEGEADPNRRFFTVYDDPDANNLVGVEVVEIFGEVFEFPFSTPLPFKSRNVGAAFGNAQTEAWGHQTTDTKAVYEFSGLDPGKYNVWVLWAANQNNSASTPHTVFDGSLSEGGVQVHTATINQGQSPGVSTDGRVIKVNGINRLFGELGTGLQIDSGTLRLEITGNTGAVHPSDEYSGDPDQVYQAELSLAVADVVAIGCTQEPYYPERCDGETRDPIDDGEAGYSQTAGWASVVEEHSLGGSHVSVAAGSGDETVDYDFSGLVPGQYSVWAYFPTGPGQATNAPFTVSDGPHDFLSVTVNQSYEYEGANLDGDGRLWYRLGYYEIRDGNVRVTISNAADGTVVADAVRLHCAFGTSTGCPDGIYGRECRREDAMRQGATQETEDAVEAGLQWLALHQLPDGSWSYEHTQGTGAFVLESPEACAERCGNIGSESDHVVAATAMALWPFLGAGIGPTDETYGDVVTAGINYLLEHGYEGEAVVDNYGAMRSPDARILNGFHPAAPSHEQGIGSQTLVEALGVCRESGFGDIDSELLEQVVRLVVKRVVACQSKSVGGWHYNCGLSADAIGTSWTLPALVGAASLGIDFEGMAPQYNTMDGARGLLKTLEASDPVPDPKYGDFATDYLYGPSDYWYGGWHQAGYQHAVLGSPLQAAGLQQLADRVLVNGPETNFYLSFYSHYFIKRVGGPRWGEWDDRTKTYLLDEQASDGHQAGSWYHLVTWQERDMSLNCGRLWCTVAALVRLQSYYRDFQVSQTSRVGKWFAGDVDDDGDVDVADIIIAFHNFTGPNIIPTGPFFSKTAAEGDVEPDGGDGDVDVNDIILMFTTFTGPNAPQ